MVVGVEREICRHANEINMFCNESPPHSPLRNFALRGGVWEKVEHVRIGLGLRVGEQLCDISVLKVETDFDKNKKKIMFKTLFHNCTVTNHPEL